MATRRERYEAGRAPYAPSEARLAATGLCDCGHAPSECASFTTGYGWDADYRTNCYACCADLERARMVETGRATLYLTGGRDGAPVEVTDWTGSLCFRAYGVRATRIGFCRDGRIAYFTGPDGARWSARGPGLGMYARARRLK